MCAHNNLCGGGECCVQCAELELALEVGAVSEFNCLTRGRMHKLASHVI